MPFRLTMSQIIFRKMYKILCSACPALSSATHLDIFIKFEFFMKMSIPFGKKQVLNKAKMILS